MSEEKIDINESLKKVAELGKEIGESGKQIGESLKKVARAMKEVSTEPKKILKIKKGEYLREILRNGVSTTYHIEDALDIRSWSIEQLGHIVSNLKQAGYVKAEVLTIEEEVDTDEV